MASNFNGAFAKYVTGLATEVLAVESDWSDDELVTIPVPMPPLRLCYVPPAVQLFMRLR